MIFQRGIKRPKELCFRILSKNLCKYVFLLRKVPYELIEMLFLTTSYFYFNL